MDDLILIHHDRETLEQCQREVIEEITKIGFEVNPKKTRIYPLRNGIMFLGFEYRLTDTGKVVMTADPAKVKTGRKKYRRLVAKARRGEITKADVDASWATWINHLSKGNSYKLIGRLNAYYKSLWEVKNNEHQETDHDSCGTGETRERAGAGREKQG